MPITASLGALSYSRISMGINDWYIQFENDVYLKSMSNIGSMLYLLADDGANLLASYTNVIDLQGDSHPRIIWGTQMYPPAFPAYSASASATGATQDNIVLTTGASANFAINDPIRFTGTVFGGVSTGVTYYVLGKPTTNSISVSLTIGGAVVQLTTATGNMTVSKYYGTIAPWTDGYKIKYNSYNSTLYATGKVYEYMQNYTDGVGTSAFIEKIDLNGTYSGMQRNKSPNPTWVTQAYRYYGDIAFLSSTDYFAIGETYVPVSTVTNSAGRPRMIYSRTNTSAQSYEKYYQGSQTTAGTNENVFCENTTAGTINIAYAYNGRSINHDGEWWTTTIQNVNPTTGAVNWSTTLYPGSDVATPVTDWPQRFVNACLDTSDNTYIVTQESGIVPPTSSLGGFIIKLNSSGTVQWQNHIDEFQPSGVCTDNIGNVYIIGSTPITGSSTSGAIYIAKFDSSGSLQWCNELADSSSTYNLKSLEIIHENGYLYVTGNLFTLPITNNLLGGMVFRLNADGTIPGTGTYNVVTPSVSYPLTYSSFSPTISASNILISYSAVAVTASSSTIDTLTYTTTDNIDPTTIIPLR